MNVIEGESFFQSENSRIMNQRKSSLPDGGRIIKNSFHKYPISTVLKNKPDL